MFEVKRAKVGHALLEDGSELNIRVIINSIQEVSMLPVGPDLGIAQQVSIAIDSPDDLRSKVSMKPLQPLDNSHLKSLSIWENIKIVESVEALEEIQFIASDGKLYKVVLEVEPTIVSRTLEYRDNHNNPVYSVRWSNKVAMYLVE